MKSEDQDHLASDDGQSGPVQESAEDIAREIASAPQDEPDANWADRMGAILASTPSDLTVSDLDAFASLIRTQALKEAIEQCNAERSEFAESAARNDGRESDFAFGSVNSAERIAEAIRSLLDTATSATTVNARRAARQGAEPDERSPCAVEIQRGTV